MDTVTPTGEQVKSGFALGVDDHVIQSIDLGHPVNRAGKSKSTRRVRRRLSHGAVLLIALGSLVGLTRGGYGINLARGTTVQSTSTGSLVIGLSNLGGTVAFSTSVSNLYPDDATATDNVPTDAWDDRVVQIANTSSSISTLSLQISGSALAGGADGVESFVSGAGPDSLAVTVWRCRVGITDTPSAYTQTLADDPAVCGAAEQLLLAETDIPLTQSTLIATLPASTNANLRIRLRLPNTAPNTGQGDSATLTFAFRLAPARTAGAA